MHQSMRRPLGLAVFVATFILFALLIVRMYWILGEVPGGQPIGGLERVFARIGPAMRSLLIRLRLVSAGA